MSGNSRYCSWWFRRPLHEGTNTHTHTDTHTRARMQATYFGLQSVAAHRVVPCMVPQHPQLDLTAASVVAACLHRHLSSKAKESSNSTPTASCLVHRCPEVFTWRINRVGAPRGREDDSFKQDCYKLGALGIVHPSPCSEGPSVTRVLSDFDS